MLGSFLTLAPADCGSWAGWRAATEVDGAGWPDNVIPGMRTTCTGLLFAVGIVSFDVPVAPAANVFSGRRASGPLSAASDAIRWGVSVVLEDGMADCGETKDSVGAGGVAAFAVPLSITSPGLAATFAGTGGVAHGPEGSEGMLGTGMRSATGAEVDWISRMAGDDCGPDVGLAERSFDAAVD
jgi:hypothetical protein